ncbi:MAG: PD40 domain-containing protein [Anaerolineales bacterium]|nr:PD40 domain-containing protein [Anaerolineales bacterium]
MHLPGNKIQTLSADAGNITAFAYSSNGNLIAAARNDFSLALLNPASKTEIYTWSAHTGLINAFIFSPDGKWLVSASNDYKVNIWDMSQITPSLLFPVNLPVGAQSLAFNLAEPRTCHRPAKWNGAGQGFCDGQQSLPITRT